MRNHKSFVVRADSGRRTSESVLYYTRPLINQHHSYAARRHLHMFTNIAAMKGGRAGHLKTHANNITFQSQAPDQPICITLE